MGTLMAGGVAVPVYPPSSPAGHGWPATLALRDQARAAVQAPCAEPDVS